MFQVLIHVGESTCTRRAEYLKLVSDSYKNVSNGDCTSKKEVPAENRVLTCELRIIYYATKVRINF